MINILKNHKFQAFYLSFLFFLPLLFLLFSSITLFKIEFKNQEVFSLSMRQFTINSSQDNIIQQEKENIPIPPIPPIKEKIIENHKPKKHKEFKKKPLIKENLNKFNEAIVSKEIQNLNSNSISKQNIETESVNFNDNHPFLQEIKKAIQDSLIYPRQAIKMRMMGVVLIEFLWKQEGKLEYLKIIKSSGHKLLDESALKTIQLASKHFPKYDKNIKILIPINYKLKN
ncbi:energy transducer TonB [Campylobacter sp. 2018MI34]|uniref:energy transducer TonB n=2 Tax=unclassified Campylobacter TaxID=2593542 RepID=UPI001905A569|nr:energy transducer TonB [Campylobacter sp. 2018MI34]